MSRSAALGGSGAIKSAGQVKGGLTGLYLVKKTVYVQHSGSGTRRNGSTPGAWTA
ncbi:hypothetical protein NKH18_17370 [Streptomyces sp. M10(2022)]